MVCVRIAASVNGREETLGRESHLSRSVRQDSRRQQIKWVDRNIPGNPKKDDYATKGADPNRRQKYLRQVSSADFEERVRSGSIDQERQQQNGQRIERPGGVQVSLQKLM
jgi:hypothetical protein